MHITDIVTIFIARQPDERKKTITGLDVSNHLCSSLLFVLIMMPYYAWRWQLYSVSEGGEAKYIQNVWEGKFPLNKQASISDTVPANATAGLYYYR